MRFGVLGPIEVDDGGDVVQLTPQSQRLVGILAMRPGDVVAADDLAELLGASPGDLGVVRMAISRLRRAVGRRVATAAGGYRLVLEGDDVIDSARFEALIATARNSEDTPARLLLLREGLALWRGSPFGGFDHEWAAGTIARLGELRATTAEDAAEALIDLGRPSEALLELDLGSDVMRFRERPVELGMRASAAAGRVTEALRTFQRFRADLRYEVGIEPSARLRDLEGELLALSAGEPASPVAPVLAVSGRLGNVARPLTTSFGRVDVIDLLASVLDEHRLVTLVGPGGVGKTRTATEAALASAGDHADGIWFVSLAALDARSSVVAAIAGTLAIRQQQSMTDAEAVVDWLRDRHVLLILDNCEHVREPVAALVQSILRAAPTVTVLATSREPIDVGGEQIFRIGPLRPDDAVALFVDRARSADLTTPLEPIDRDVAREICVQLDCMPLALELAAARVRVLAPTDILTRLDDRFRLLRTASKHADERHRTLHNTVAWSYDLLLEPEQRLFDRLSAFAGSFSPEAVEAVCSDDAIDRDIVIDLLDRLVAKSMIVATRTSRGVRYHLLATLRAFATEKLGQRGETAQLRDRHLHHALTIGASSAAMIVTAKQLEASERFDESWDDLRDAHRWCLDTNDLTSAKALVGSVQIFAILRGRFEFLEWAQRTIDACAERRIAAPAAFGARAMLEMMSGDNSAAITAAETGIAAADNPVSAETVHCWTALAAVLTTMGRPDDARRER